MSLLSGVDCGKHRSKIVRPPRFYLNKAKDLAVQSDYVDLASYLNSFRISTHGNLEIRNNDSVVKAEKVLGG